MTDSPDPVALTQDLVRLDTVNPPGNEARAIDLIERLLAVEGFTCARQPIGAGRANLVACFGVGDGAPIAFTGHVDTVPLGDTPWTRDPHGATIEGDRLYGRGSSDMKGGVAAMITAAIGLARDKALKHGVVLLITAGEEIGSEGALAMRAGGPLGFSVSALVVAEPTANRLALGHKGALFLKATATGVTAHSSMPQEGVNAAYKIARAALRVADFTFPEAPHPVLGAPTANVGILQAGQAANTVPDRGTFLMDVRSVPGQDHAAVKARLDAALGADASLAVIHDLPAVWTEPGEDFARAAGGALAGVTGGNNPPLGMPYFTDASVLTPWLGCPTIILGPGEPTEAHKTDEWCSLAKIREAERLYTAIAQAWDARG